MNVTWSSMTEEPHSRDVLLFKGAPIRHRPTPAWKLEADWATEARGFHPVSYIDRWSSGGSVTLVRQTPSGDYFFFLLCVFLQIERVMTMGLIKKKNKSRLCHQTLISLLCLLVEIFTHLLSSHQRRERCVFVNMHYGLF